jgi:ribosomal protein S18 acetylase RimI-like enzyme
VRRRPRSRAPAPVVSPIAARNKHVFGRYNAIVDRLASPAEVRSLLCTDRSWSVYALGDLVPQRFDLCRCYGVFAPSPAAVVLYRGFSPPVLFAFGDPGAIAELPAAVTGEPELYLHVRPQILPVVAAHYRIVSVRRMWRMILDAESLPALSAGGLEPLGPEHAGELEQLYGEARTAGEAPGFFLPSMLEEGVFFGARQDSELVAVAGTHLVAPEEGVAAIGNVYTRPECRGRGLATRLTGAVAAELVRRGIPLVALNVCPANLPAVRAYRRLGFFKYCEFVEGLAVRKP